MRPIILSGRVIHGDGYGSRLGFPTANLDRRRFVRLSQRPRLGIWAARAELKIINPKARPGRVGQSKVFPAAVVIGPIDKKGLPKVEAHLIGFRGNLYGRAVTLMLRKYLRPFREFADIEALKRQIQRDIAIIKKSRLF